MFQSYQYSHLLLRCGIAFVFFWLGVEKFMQPATWVGSSVPHWIQAATATVGMSAANVFVLTGIFQILIATSLATAFFEQWFAPAGVFFLVCSLFAADISQTTAYDVGLIACLLALLLWPQRRYS